MLRFVVLRFSSRRIGLTNAEQFVSFSDDFVVLSVLVRIYICA